MRLGAYIFFRNIHVAPKMKQNENESKMRLEGNIWPFLPEQMDRKKSFVRQQEVFFFTYTCTMYKRLLIIFMHFHFGGYALIKHPVPKFKAISHRIFSRSQKKDC